MSPINLERDENIAIITLNRPEAANAINIEFAAELRDTAKALAEANWARAIVLQAEGKMFSGGGDVAEMLRQRAKGSESEYQEFFKKLVSGLHEAVLALRDVGVPLIAAVNGTAAGGGMSLVLACDEVIATNRAKFVPAYPGIGLSTDGGMSWSLSRIVGPKKALHLICGNRPIGAEEALGLGIVDAIVEEAALSLDARQKAKSLAALPRHAFAGIRHLIDNAGKVSFDRQLDDELRAIAKLCIASDAREGLDAFSEKRAPRFTD